MAAAKLRIRVEEEVFLISGPAAKLSGTIRTMLEDCDGYLITLPNIGRRTFPMIISYLEKHADVNLTDQERWNFDREFASSETDLDILRKLMIDAYYLKIETLQRVLAPKMADLLKIYSKSWIYEELRQEFEFETPGWKEELVETVLEIDWAAEDAVVRRMHEQEELEQQAKKINIQ
ncbi:suppressor of kinetochore protein mutant [Castilleja foliolosa]|uniref:Suppressor of kinetochore protein mutant n=1 Tax=Castilleja foliolosa TaxID=1961234 RepID=A0ABD3BNZ2_9LAMI